MWKFVNHEIILIALAFAAFQARKSSVVFSLDIGTETLNAAVVEGDIEQVHTHEHAHLFPIPIPIPIPNPQSPSLSPCAIIAQIGVGLPSAEPRFVLHVHGTSTLFIYYCPESADRRLKMSYSTFKRHALECVAAQNIDVTHKIQCCDQTELTHKHIDADIGISNNAATDKEESFARPARRGRGAARISRKKI